MALMVLKKFAVEITDENTENYLSADDLTSYMNWSLNGGQTTVEEFRKLSSDEQQDIMEKPGMWRGRNTRFKNIL